MWITTNQNHAHRLTQKRFPIFTMSLFKKPKKNIQRRAFSDLTEERDEAASQDGGDDVEMQEIPKAKAKEAKPEKQPKERQSKTLLSFGDEEGKTVCAPLAVC